MSVITRVAGTGTLGNGGDGGPAPAAELSFPLGVAVTADGWFLIADAENHVVRKVSSAGVITRVAGTGNPGDVPFTGPPSLVMSHEYTCRGAVATSSGHTCAGCRANRRRSATSALSRSSRYIVDSEHV